MAPRGRSSSARQVAPEPVDIGVDGHKSRGMSRWLSIGLATLLLVGAAAGCVRHARHSSGQPAERRRARRRRSTAAPTAPPCADRAADGSADAAAPTCCRGHHGAGRGPAPRRFRPRLRRPPHRPIHRPPATSAPPTATAVPLVVATSTALPVVAPPTLTPTVLGPTATPPPGADQSALPRLVSDQLFVAGGAVPAGLAERSELHRLGRLLRAIASLRARPNEFVAIGNPSAQRLRDMVVTARFAKVGGPPGGGFGVIVRDQAPWPARWPESVGQLLRARGRRSRRSRHLAPRRQRVGRSGAVDPVSRRAARQCRERAHRARRRAATDAAGQRHRGRQRIEDATLAEGTTGVFVGGDQNQVLLRQLTRRDAGARGRARGR